MKNICHFTIAHLSIISVGTIPIQIHLTCNVKHKVVKAYAQLIIQVLFYCTPHPHKTNTLHTSRLMFPF